jgi:hypothetical protein
MNLNTLRTGDLIVRQKGPFSTHYIVWIGWKNGVQVVAENHNGEGVRYTSLEEALAGKPIKRLENFGGTESQRSLVISEINKMLGRSYDLVVFNCEHFARWISTGRTESKQVEITSNIAVFGGAALLTSKNKVVQAIGAFSLIAGVIGHLSQSNIVKTLKS